MATITPINAQDERRRERRAIYGMSHPAAMGEVVKQGHADYCRDYGHATYTIEGVDQGWCPRCGATTATPAPMPADSAPAPTEAPTVEPYTTLNGDTAYTVKHPAVTVPILVTPVGRWGARDGKYQAWHSDTLTTLYRGSMARCTDFAVKRMTALAAMTPEGA